MKKLQRKLSTGLVKAHSEEKEMSTFNANDENQVKTSEDNPRSRVRYNGVRRSNTIAAPHHQSHSISPARVLQRKDSNQSKPSKKCGICYEDFTQPKQLPCLCTFCRNCLEKFVNPKLMVECPTCRKVTSQSTSLLM